MAYPGNNKWFMALPLISGNGFGVVFNNHLTALLIGAFLFFLSGCSAGITDFSNSEKSLCDSLPDMSSGGTFSLFLNLAEPDVSAISVVVDSIDLLIDDLWIPMLPSTVIMDSKAIGRGQVFLARRKIEGVVCQGLRLTVQSASNLEKGKEQLVILEPETTVMFAPHIALENGKSRILQVVWDVQNSIKQKKFERLAITVFPERTDTMTENLALVACPDIDMVYVVSLDTWQVRNSFMVKGSPIYPVADKNLNRIYVLTKDDGKIMIYNLSNYHLEQEIIIPMAYEPIRMGIDFDEGVAFVLDSHGVVSAIELSSGSLLSRNRVGKNPNYIILLPEHNKIAVSSDLDQRVYLLNARSLEIETSISLGDSPSSMAIWQNTLYISQKMANQVTIYDLIERRVIKSVHAGYGPESLAVAGNKIYVGNMLDGNVTIIQGGQFNVVREVSVGRTVAEMSLAENLRLLFVGEGGCNGKLAVIDTVGNQLISRVELGARPHGISVVE